MKNKSKNLSIVCYALCVIALLLIVCGLIFLLSSCTKEIEDQTKPYTGTKIAVKFKFSGVTKQGNEVLTHSGSTSLSPPTPLLGDSYTTSFGIDRGEFGGSVMHVMDDIFMYATLKEAQDIKLRTDTMTLSSGAKLRKVAFQHGTIYHTHKDYTIVGNGNLHGGLFRVVPGYYYKFEYSLRSSIGGYLKIPNK